MNNSGKDDEGDQRVAEEEIEFELNSESLSET